MSEAFGELLKVWRGQRRMSQLDLGLAANVSARHISFLETGRANPSKAMVMQLSETLDVPRSTRNVLLTAAGFSKAYRARDLSADDMSHAQDAILWMLQRHDPFPGMAMNRHWELIAANTCASGLLGSIGVGLGDSLLDALTDPGPFREAVGNWPEVAYHMATRLRTEIAHLGGDPVLAKAADRLAQDAAMKAFKPGEALPALIPAIYKANGQVLSFVSTIAHFGSAEDISLADIKIELMFPADATTKAALLPT